MVINSVPAQNLRQVRSIGGQVVNKTEYPWVAFITRTISTKQPVQKRFCSGAQISRKHILTAAHCVVHPVDKKNICKNMQTKNPKYVRHQNSDITILAGSSCIDPLSCPITETKYRPKEILVHPEYDPCGSNNDLAIITLTTEISKSDGSPICTPSRREQFPTEMLAVGFGIDPTNAYKLKLRSVELSYAVTTKQGKGDSGGPLVKTNATGSYHLVGIAFSTTPICTIKNPLQKTFTDYFDNTFQRASWICQNSGVCPLPGTDEEDISGC
ncbi:trypsin [Dictyocaulus viviparus]|uniref:Trypsin n=1 Tax=Dictyocaulus viviparus TaxID=29172 RepID=A0A0D8X910_DICVI|nr:trypsin [Dictyocaulus viviparus]